ncbi:MAG: tetratricopeptide repeat protein [Proteobacteria bacterium]|nr:tetratricopeptide repeat protein [Pseudomonadota bacterium]
MMIGMRRLTVLGMMSLMIFVHAGAQASEAAREYLEGIQLYNQGHYEKAATLFETVAEKGVINGKLYYNAGNAWFKEGNIGRAMLWYERALNIMPHDPDLRYNHDYVTGLLKDKSEDKTSPVFKVLFFWKEMLNKNIIRWLALGFFLIFWVRVVIGMLNSGRSMKLIDWLFLSLALVFTFTSFNDFYNARFNEHAIVLVESVSVRSGLTEESTELFVLHSGTRVGVDDELRGYVKIRFSDDKIGWIKREDIEII